jgi:putative membrane protein
MTEKSPATKPPAVNAQHRRYVLWLAGIFGALTAALGIAPWYRQDWLLENALVAAAVPVLWGIYRRIPFSKLSWTLVFLFLCLHEVGAHYTYSEVPYESWWRSLTGGSFNALVGWDRNNFDRIIHLAYGLMIACPVREIFVCLARLRGFWSYLIPLDLTMSSSALYELIEWGAAVVFGGDLGAAYTGIQGDEWDAQKDMVLAATGALVSLTLAALINWKYQRDFAREWTDSLRIPRPKGPPA